MILLFVVVGQNIKHYQQAYYAIYSALKYKDADDTVLVLAQEVDYFKQFENRIEIHGLKLEQVTKQEKSIELGYKEKIKAMELAFALYPDKHVLLFDTDVFIAQDLAPVKEKLDQGCNFLHHKQDRIQDLPTKSGRMMYRELNNKRFGAMMVDAETVLYSSGVVGVNNASKDVLKQVLQLCDQLYLQLSRPQYAEQVAFSLVLAHQGALQTCAQVVGHYRHNQSGFDNFIYEFLMTCFMNNLCIDQIIERLDHVDYGVLPIYVKDSSTKNKLIKALDKMFPIKEKKFFKVEHLSEPRT